MRAGIQISSFRPLMTELDGLKRVLGFMRDIGCEYTQLQWIDRRISPKDAAIALDESGVKALGVQDKAYAVFGDPGYYLDLCVLAGGGDICVSGAEETGLDAFLAGLDALMDAAMRAGFTVSYHPTKRDFDAALELIMRRYGELRLTLDMCQAHDAGVSVSQIAGRYAGRIDTVHFKDRDPGGALCPVGQGVIDFEGAALACQRAGAVTLLAEQEQWRDAFGELSLGFEYTKRLAEKYR